MESGDIRVVVSTVGCYRSSRGEVETIGRVRYYETMAFRASLQGSYWDADVSEEIGFSSPGAVDDLSEDSDLRANAMHEEVVSELSRAMTVGRDL